MKKIIYESDFDVGPTATKKQEMLFSTDLEYAIEEGYGFIQTRNGVVFKIISKDNLFQVDVTEEQLQEAEKQLADAAKAMSEFDNLNDRIGSKDLHSNNLFLIDSVINNTLSDKADITPQKADTMIKLAKLKEMLVGVRS